MGSKLSTLQFDIPNENNKCRSPGSLSNPTNLSFIFFCIRAEGGYECQWHLSLLPAPRNMRNYICCPRNSHQSQPLSNASPFFWMQCIKVCSVNSCLYTFMCLAAQEIWGSCAIWGWTITWSNNSMPLVLYTIT